MKKQFTIFMILDTVVRYILNFIVNKAWGKTGRTVPKDNGERLMFPMEYLVYKLTY